MSFCKNCGAQIADDSRFCSECGKEITQTNVCPHCGASVGEGDVYCQNCGRNLIDGSYADNSIINNQIQDNEESPTRNWIPYILGAIALIAICGGGLWYYNSSKSSQFADGLEVADTTTAMGAKEKAIMERVKSIFDKVYSADVDSNADSKYLTTEYKKLIDDANRLSEDEVGYFDSDHWIQGQDCMNPSMTVESVNMFSDDKAEAKIKIKAIDSSDYEKEVKLIMVFERGDWFIDDFITYLNGEEQSEKKGLLEYISIEKERQNETNYVDTVPVSDIDTAVIAY